MRARGSYNRFNCFGPSVFYILKEISTLLSDIHNFPYLGLFFLLILGGFGLPFPEDATLILCGVLISTQVVSPLPALIVVYAGLLIADLTLHFIGRKYGRPIINHRYFHKLISKKRLLYLEEQFSQRGSLIIFLGRHLVGLRAQIFLASGALHMSAVKFFLADALSSLFTMALMIGAGYLGGHSLEVLKRDLSRFEHLGIILLVVSLIIYLFYRFFWSENKKGQE